MVKLRTYIFKGHHLNAPKILITASRRILAINKIKNILVKKHKYYTNENYINHYLKISQINK